MPSVALAYRELWRVEAIFRSAKSILETRPIFHQSDAAIAGQLFCSFFALLLRKELDERLTAAGVTTEWGDSVRDLDRVGELTVEQGRSASCCGRRQRGAPVPCSRRWESRCPRWCAKCRPARRRRLRQRQHRPAAAEARGGLSRHPEFSGFALYVEPFIEGTVQLEPGSLFR